MGVDVLQFFFNNLCGYGTQSGGAVSFFGIFPLHTGQQLHFCCFFPPHTGQLPFKFGGFLTNFFILNVIWRDCTRIEGLLLPVILGVYPLSFLLYKDYLKTESH